MNKEQFLEELEKRLEENRELAERTILPRQLHGLASYLAFHTLRGLLLLSGIITAGMFGFEYEGLIKISRRLFGYE